MTQSPPKSLIQHKAAQDSGDFGAAKYELRDVDVEAEAADVQAQAVVEQTGGEPAGEGRREVNSSRRQQKNKKRTLRLEVRSHRGASTFSFNKRRSRRLVAQVYAS